MLRVLRGILSSVYLILILLTIPLAFDLGGTRCGLAFSLTVFALYFILTTVRLVSRRSKYLRWMSFIYYSQHIFLPSILTFFISYFNSHQLVDIPNLKVVDIWRLLIVNSTPVFTILEGFCTLLSIQAVGKTINWLTVNRSDSWLIVSLIGSGSVTTGAIYFLYRIYLSPFAIDMASLSLLGSVLTMTGGVGLYGIVSGKGSMVESSLLFAYIVRCVYETFPALSDRAVELLSNMFQQASTNLKQDIPSFPPLPSKVSTVVQQVITFLAANLPHSFKTVGEFLIEATQKITVLPSISLIYRIGVFYAATKIIPSLYHESSLLYLTSSSPTSTPPSPLSTPTHLRSRQVSRTLLARDVGPSTGSTTSSSMHLTSSNQRIHESSITTDSDNVFLDDHTPRKDEDDLLFITPIPSGVRSLSPINTRTPNYTRVSPRKSPSSLLKFVYAYSPCIIIAVYTHLMMQYSGELGKELKIWTPWKSTSEFTIITHPWQFWNWVNMVTTLVLYTMELIGNHR